MAGSFFKTPLVSLRLLAEFTENTTAAYHSIRRLSGEVKLACLAGFDQCELKGFRQGGAAVDMKSRLWC